MSYFEPETWRALTPKEVHGDVSAKLEKGKRANQKKPASKRRKRGIDVPNRAGLVLHSSISPLDLYTYLKARFGPPNGFQTFLAKDDSDNLYHWDYELDCDEGRLTFTGATQEVHVLLTRELTDQEWHRFISAIKGDFARVGKAKSAITRGLEKWHIFPNRYLALANKCAALYDDLTSSFPELQNILSEGIRLSDPNFEERSKTRSVLLDKVIEASLELPVLIPVLFETFIGLIVAALTKPEVKGNEPVFESFRRSNLNVKLFDLANRCDGFLRPISPDNEAMKRYWKIVNNRNDIIHGNLDFVKDAVEIVYFDGKRPLYPAGGDRIAYFWDGLIRQYKPEQVISDYEAMHAFIIDILNHMTPSSRLTMTVIMEDTQPGWDDRRRKLGRLFPSRLVTGRYQGAFYDSDLEPYREEDHTA